jgi:hypothetical protein
MEETTIVAYEMNGQPLPHFNGFPARVIVPGWTGTYWMKHVTSINAVTKQFSGFWMNPAYRIPLHAFPLVERFTSQDSAVSTPITEMVMNSLITSHTNGASVGRAPPSLSAALPGTAATAFEPSRFRPTAARPGCLQCSAKTLAGSPSAPSARAFRQRARASTS